MPRRELPRQDDPTTGVVAAEGGPDPEEEPSRRSGLLARVGERSGGWTPESAERWREAVLLRLDRMERLLEQSVSGLPPIEEQGRRAASDTEVRLAALAEQAAAGLERLGALADRVEAVTAENADRVEAVRTETMHRLAAVRSELLESLDASRVEGKDRLDAARAEAVGQIESARSQILDRMEVGRGEAAERTDRTRKEILDQVAAFRAESSDRVEAIGASTVQELEARISKRLDQVAGSLPGVLEARVEAAVRKAQQQTERALDLMRGTVTEVTGRMAGSLDDVFKAQGNLGSAVEGHTRAIREERKATAEALRGVLARAESSLREATTAGTAAVHAATEGVTSSVRASIDAMVTSIQTEATGRLAELRRATEEEGTALRRSIAEAAERVTGATDRAVLGLRGGVESGVAAIGRGLDAAAQDLRTRGEELASALAAETARLSDVVATLRQEERGLTESTEALVARVESLAEIIESLGRRRGFRQLVESEEELRAQQVRLVQDLKAEGEALSRRIGDLEGRMEGLREATGQVERRQAEASAGVTGAAHDLRQAVNGLRQGIEGWGASRPAPQLAKELADVRSRVEAVEGPVLARLDALAQAVEALARRLNESQDRRGGLFRRARP